jgi:hypothetical protein
MRDAKLQGTGKDRADCINKFRAASDRFSSDPARLTEFLEMRKRLRRAGPAPSTTRSRCPAVASSSRSRKPGHGFSQLYSAGIALVSGRSGSQRLTRRLYPTEGMRSKHKEYRQHNHRPSSENGNPVQHRDIVRRIWTQDTRYRRDMPVVVPSREWPPLLTGPGIPMQVVVPSVS